LKPLPLKLVRPDVTGRTGKEKKPKNFDENKIIAKQGGTIADDTRKAIEAKTGKKVVSNLNAKGLRLSVVKKKLE
jgi:hypothetical protein